MWEWACAYTRLGLPSVGLVALLFTGCLVLVGPVNYLILKRRDKREWGWVTVPAISSLFVAAVYGLSMGRRAPLLSHLITVTELSPGAGSATPTAARSRWKLEVV